FDRKALADLAELWDNTPAWRAAADFALSLSDIHYLDELATIAGVSETYGADEIITAAIIEFRSQTDPVAKAEMWEGLFAWAQRELNPTQAVDLLEKFTRAGGGYDTDQYGTGWAALSTAGPLALFG